MTKYLKNHFSKQKILTTLKHEIRNPLFNIKSFLETLYEYHFQLTDSQIIDFLEVANRETSRLVRLTNNSLNIAVFNSYVSQLFNLFFLGRLIKQALVSYELTTLNKNVCLYTKYHFPFLKSIGNYDLLLQVLHNLINNSLKSVYPNAVIIIKIKCSYFLSLEARKKSTIIRVDLIDTGIGIKKKNPFLILDDSLELKKSCCSKNGLGIGLSIVKDILFIHKRTINIHSIENKGVQISFSLF